MPFYAKRKRNSSRPRKYSRKVYRKKPVVPRLRRPYADSKIVSMRYCDNIQLDALTAGGGVSHLFRANSIFDPDITGAGHQPMGHDQLATQFRHYTVLGSKIVVKALNAGADGNAHSMFSCQLVDAAYSASTVTSFIEQKRGTYCVLGIAAGGKAFGQVTGKYSCRKFFNIKDPSSDNTQRTQMGFNPSEDAIFYVSTQSLTNGDPAAIDCLVTIDYIVKFTEPIALGQS